MSFRIRSFFVEKNDFSTPLVHLSKSEKVDEENYFTVIIGNNGTGKSRFLVNLVDSFREIYKSNRRIDFDYNLEYELSNEIFNVERIKHQKIHDRIQNRTQHNELGVKAPKKIIAITTSLSDKFPMGHYYKKNDPESLKEVYYSYLGVRNKMGAASNRALMDKAISLMLSSINEAGNNEEYREIFNYLNYEPIIKLVYQVSSFYFKNKGHDAENGSELKKIIKERTEKRGGLRLDYFRRLLEAKDDEYWEELAAGYMLIVKELSQLGKKMILHCC